MVKKIIFDLDNTLIEWKDYYINAIKETVLEYKLDIDYHKLHNLVEDYELYYNNYSKEQMIDLFNKKLNLNLDVTFLDKWFSRLGKMAIKDEEVIDTIKYLSSKYELVVLTNFIKELQIERLKTAGLYEYFKSVIGGELFIKPSIESFNLAIRPNKPDECIMIGDNIDIDIKGAINAGVRAILIDIHNNKEYDGEVIHKISELKEML